MTQLRVYLDWNASAPIHPVARMAFLQAADLFANPNSVHHEGRAVRRALETARSQVATLVHANSSHVTFTSGATEAANLVLTPDFRMGRAPLSVGRLFYSALEHPAVREGGRFPKEKTTEIAALESGVIDLQALESQLLAYDLSAGIPMVALMLVNNETGIIQPVSQAAKITAQYGGILVVDAVQAAGKMPLDINDLGADFLILSSHKIGGPKGAGALVARGEMLKPEPLIKGGGQEKGHRSGTENVPAIIGFGAAVHAALAELDERNARIEQLRNRLEAGLLGAAPDVIIHGKAQSRVCNTCFFTLPDLKAETGQIAFDIEGVALSAGSACASGKVGESYVLSAMGQNAQMGALRISLGFSTTEDDIDRALAAFTKIANRRKRTGEAA